MNVNKQGRIKEYHSHYSTTLNSHYWCTCILYYTLTIDIPVSPLLNSQTMREIGHALYRK